MAYKPVSYYPNFAPKQHSRPIFQCQQALHAAIILPASAFFLDTSLAPRSGDLALCEIYGERMLKYIRRKGREL